MCARWTGSTSRSGRAELRERIGVSLQETQFGDKLTVLETVGLVLGFFVALRMFRWQ